MDILNGLANSITVNLAVGRPTASCEDIILSKQQRARLQCPICVGSALECGMPVGAKGADVGISQNCCCPIHIS